MGDLLQWTLHHPDDGAVLHLHRADLQRLLLQVSQHIRLWLERQGHVYQSAVDVSNQRGFLLFCHFKCFIILSFFTLRRNKTLQTNALLTLDPNVSGVFGGPYPFGIDPVSEFTEKFQTEDNPACLFFSGLMVFCFFVRFGTWRWTGSPFSTPTRWRCRLSSASFTCALEWFSVSSITCKWVQLYESPASKHAD